MVLIDIFLWFVPSTHFKLTDVSANMTVLVRSHIDTHVLWLKLQRHDDVIKWKPYWPFVRGIQFTGLRWMSPTKASDVELWCFLICAWTNCWVNNCDARDLRRHRAHYDFTVMILFLLAHVVRMAPRNDFPMSGVHTRCWTNVDSWWAPSCHLNQTTAIFISLEQLQAVTWRIWEIWGKSQFNAPLCVLN